MLKNKKKGYVLVSVMMMSVLLFLLGSSALFMTQLGNQTLALNIQHEKANYASEFGIGKAIEKINSSSCGAKSSMAVDQWEKLEDSKASYNYYTFADSENKYCFVYSIGKFNASKSVKTVVVPVTTVTTNYLPVSPINSKQTILSASLLGLLPDVTSVLAKLDISNKCGDSGLIASLFKSENLLTGLFGVVTSLLKTLSLDAVLTKNGEIADENAANAESENYYKSAFGADSGVKDYATMVPKIDSIITDKASSNNADCNFNPSDVTGSTCTTQSDGKISCTQGSTTKTINPLSCANVVLSAANVNIINDIPATTNMAVNASKNLNITSSVSGFMTSDGKLNINTNNKTLDGIFIGDQTSAMKLSGNTVMKGMYFLSNNPNINTVDSDINLLDTVKVSGAIFVDGNMRLSNVADGVKIDFDPENINKWGSYLSNFLFGFSCPGDPNGTSSTVSIPKASYIQRTKMVMY